MHKALTFVLSCLVVSAFAADQKYTAVSRGPHQTVWQQVQHLIGPSGKATHRTNSYVEIASGLNHQSGGQWLPTSDEIEIDPILGGATAKHTAHKVTFSGNINALDAIEITTPDGNKRLRTRTLGLAYHDAATGQSVLFAEAKDSVGQLARRNQVLYRDCMTDLKADIRCIQSPAGFENDVILRSAPPSPANWGFNPETTRLEVWHEFFSPPEPKKRKILLPTAVPVNARQKMVAPDFIDEVLDFGTMLIGAGTAFTIGLEQPADGSFTQPIPVGKSWMTLEGRKFLVESVEYPAIVSLLEQLPNEQPQARVRGSTVNSRTQLARAFPKELPVASVSKSKMEFAMVSYDEPGVVLDYLLVNTATNFTFKGDTTYYVSGPITLSGLTTIEGGTVIKSTNANSAAGRLSIQGPIECQTSAYRPAIFTGKDDDTVGEIIFGSTGNPTTNYYGTYLYLGGNTNPIDLHDIRLRHAYYGINASSSPQLTLRHTQITRNWAAVVNSVIRIRNVLIQDGVYAIGGGASTRGEHITFHRITNLRSATYNTPLTNCLIISVTNRVYYTGENVVTNYNDTGIFETVGGGAHYLAASSAYRNAGTTNINGDLLADLGKRTTYPPVVLTNDITTATTLSPQAQRDTGLPDLGYHYDGLDFVANEIDVSAALTIEAGTALGVYGASGSYGWQIGDGGSVVCEGTVTSPCRVARYNLVQEGVSNSWAASSSGSAFLTPSQSTTVKPRARFRFTGFSMPANGGEHFYVGFEDHPPVVFVDCEFSSGKFFVDYAGAMFTNCVLERVHSLMVGLVGRFQNNLFYGGNLTLSPFLDPYYFYDNLFDKVAISEFGSSTHDYNGYVTNAPGQWLSISAANDVFTDSFTYEKGALGRYYQPTNSLFVGKGSTTPDLVGLYHYTVLTNNVKETNSVVDIGYHYIATANGLPVDSDAEGLPDYAEDANGNGLVDSTETSGSIADTDYDGVTDLQEIQDGTNPLDATDATKAALAYWTFDTSLTGGQGQQAIQSNNVTLVAGLGVKAAKLESPNTLKLIYKDVESSGDPNFNAQNGTIRFWVKPNWSSTTRGGAGPGSDARLFEAGGETDPAGWFALHFNSSGTEVRFCTRIGMTTDTNISFPWVSWSSNEWHQIALTYSASSSALYTNGVLAASGTGVRYIPSASALAAGISLGSDKAGAQKAQMQFEETEIHNYPIPPAAILQSFNGCINSPQVNTCPLYPIAIVNQAYASSQSYTLSLGHSTGNFGWLDWNGHPFNVPDLVTSLTPPGNSGDLASGYRNPDHPSSDRILSIGDKVMGSTGAKRAADVKAALDALITQPYITVPVWDQTEGAGGANFKYRVSGFARIKIDSYNLQGNGNSISFTYLQSENCENACGQAPTLTTVDPNILGQSLEDYSVPIDFDLLTLAANEADADGPAPTVFRIEAVISGTLTIDNVAIQPGQTLLIAGQTMYWTPPANVSGDIDAFSIRASDRCNVSATPVMVRPFLSGVNDPPSFTKGPNQVVLEDSGSHAVPNWATQISPGPNETGQQVEFIILQVDNPDLFHTLPAITPTGTLSYRPADNAHGVAHVTVSLQDDGGTEDYGNNLSDPQSFMITVMPDNEKPVITLPAPAITYSLDGPPLIIDATAAVQDDSPNFEGGVLTVELTANRDSGDRLRIRHQGDGVGEIGVYGSAVTFEGRVIGVFNGGYDNIALTVAFNNNATPAIAAALIRRIEFYNVSWRAPRLTRTVKMQLSDGDGETSLPVSELINVTAVNRPPIANAGPDQNISKPTAGGATVQLTGSAVDDGLPTANLTYTWAAIGENASHVTAIAPNPNVASPTVSINALGTYRLRLTVSDGALLSVPDEVEIVVRPENQPPAVNAGPDQELLTLVNIDVSRFERTTIVNRSVRPTGMDYNETSGQLLFVTHGPYETVYAIDVSGTVSDFATIDFQTEDYPFGENLAHAEAKIATVRDDGGGRGIGEFPAGEVFVGTPCGSIFRFSADGTPFPGTEPNLPGRPEIVPWVVVAGGGCTKGRVLSLYVDRTGVFGGDLLAAYDGSLYRIKENRSGFNMPIAHGLGFAQGVVTAPPDPVKYGPWAGKALVISWDRRRIFAVSPDSPDLYNAVEYHFGLELMSDIDAILPRANFYAIEGYRIVAARASSFVGMADDYLVGEDTALGHLARLNWDLTDQGFHRTDLAVTSGNWESMAFAPLLIDDMVIAQTTLDGSVEDDNQPSGSPPRFYWVQVSGPLTRISNTNILNPHVRFGDLGPHVFRLIADDGQFTVMDEVTVTVTRGGSPAINLVVPPPGILPLQRDRTLKAFVVDFDGNPVAGASVTFTISGANEHILTAITDPEGEASVTYDLATNDGKDTIVASVEVDGQFGFSPAVDVIWAKSPDLVCNTDPPAFAFNGKEVILTSTPCDGVTGLADYHSFSGIAGQTLTVQLNSTAETQGRILQLLDSAGTELAFAMECDFSTGPVALTFQLPRTDTYFIEVCLGSDLLLNYTLAVGCSDPPSPVPAIHVAVDSVLTPHNSQLVFGPANPHERRVRVQNNGSGSTASAHLTITDIRVEPDAQMPGDTSFFIPPESTLPFPLTLQPGEGREFSLVFSPKFKGERLASLIIDSDDPDRPSFKLDLKAETNPRMEITFEGRSISPGERLVFDERLSVTKQLIIRNTSDGPLSIANVVAVSPLDDFSFTAAPLPPRILYRNEEMVVSVAYIPTPGDSSVGQQLRITSNEPDFDVSLYGVGTQISSPTAPFVLLHSPGSSVNAGSRVDLSATVEAVSQRFLPPNLPGPPFRDANDALIEGNSFTWTEGTEYHIDIIYDPSTTGTGTTQFHSVGQGDSVRIRNIELTAGTADLLGTVTATYWNGEPNRLAKLKIRAVNTQPSVKNGDGAQPHKDVLVVGSGSTILAGTEAFRNVQTSAPMLDPFDWTTGSEYRIPLDVLTYRPFPFSSGDTVKVTAASVTSGSADLVGVVTAVDTVNDTVIVRALTTQEGVQNGAGEQANKQVVAVNKITKVEFFFGVDDLFTKIGEAYPKIPPTITYAAEWVPTRPGDVVLVARATDISGRIAFSSVVPVQVVAPPRPPGNTAPFAGPDEITIVRAQNSAAISPQFIPVLENDADREGDLLSVTAVTPPSQGTAAISPDGLGILYSAPASTFLGTIQFNYTVWDGQLSASAEVTVHIEGDRPPIELEPPFVQITSPGDATEVTAKVPIHGRVSMEDSTKLSYYALEYRSKGDERSPWVRLASGASVVNGNLSEFDSTLLPNGMYEIRLSAFDKHGRGTAHTIAVIVDGGAKIGHFTLAYSDVSLPGISVPIEVTRSYNSRDQATGDFGVGWKLGINSIRLQMNLPLGEYWYGQKGTEGFTPYCLSDFGPHVVSVTFPGGRVFRFKPVVDFNDTGNHCVAFDPGPAEVTMKFVAEPGTYATLSAAGATGLKVPEDDLTGKPIEGETPLVKDNVDPVPFEPTGFTLTLPDQTHFNFDADGKLLSISDSSVTLTISSDGIFEKVNANNVRGRQLSFSRDDSRFDFITAIYDTIGLSSLGHPAGLPALKYDYDDRGNLTHVHQLIDRSAGTYTTTTYRYTHPKFSNYITEIIDPRGSPAVRTFYDDEGRLKAITNGNTMPPSYTLFDRTAGVPRETIIDPEGNKTIHDYDTRGNVTHTRIEDPAGNLVGQSSREYSFADNPSAVTREVDGHGNATTYDYEPNASRMTVTRLINDEENTIQQFTNGFGYVTSVIDARSITAVNLAYNSNGDLDEARNNDDPPTDYIYNLQEFPGKVRHIVDPQGNETSFDYYGSSSSAGQLGDLSVTTVKQLIQGEQRVLSKKTYKYDANGNRTHETTWTNLNAGVEAELPHVTVIYEYDAQNRVKTTTWKAGNGSGDFSTVLSSHSTEYNSIGKTASTTDALGRVTRFEFDDRGNLVQTIHPALSDGRVSIVRTVYDLKGRPIYTQDSHFALGNNPETATTTANGIHTIYDAAGRVVRTERVANVAITRAGENAVVRTALASAGTLLSFTESKFDVAGRLERTTDSRGLKTEYGYDEAGRRTTVTRLDEANRAITTISGYDENGNLKSVTDPLGNETVFIYDNEDRRVRTRFPLVANSINRIVHEVGYDTLGRRVEEKVGTTTGASLAAEDGGTVESTKRFGHDIVGRLTAVTNNYTEPGPTTDQILVQYRYDDVGNMIEQEDPNGRITKFSYDLLNRRTKRQLPDRDSHFELFYYDGAGNLTIHTNFASIAGTINAHITELRYDALNRLTRKFDRQLGETKPFATFTYTASGQRDTAAAFTYDSAGNQQTAHEMDYQYDDHDRLWAKTTPEGTLTYTYDGNGQIESINSSNPNGTSVVYGRNQLNQLETVTDNRLATSDKATSYTYDYAGNLETVTYPQGDGQPNPLTTVYTYDTLNRLTDMRYAVGQALRATFTYDSPNATDFPPQRKLGPTGNRRRLIEAIHAPETVERRADYDYDKIYRLTKETLTGAVAGEITYDSAVGYGDTAGFDRAGNRRLRQSTVPQVSSYSGHQFDAADRLDNDSNPFNANSNYDENGNTLHGDVTPAVQTEDDQYDYENRLIRRRTAADIVTMLYDVDGNRVRKTVNGTTTFYLVDDRNPAGYAQVLEEFEANTSTPPAEGTRVVLRRYTYGHDLISQTVRPNGVSTFVTHYYGYDGHGSVRFLTSTSGAITDTYTYDAFGIMVSAWHAAAATPNRYLYSGEQFDENLGLYYLRARYYNPRTGRFWSMDSFQGTRTELLSLHKYLYAAADPVNRIDPSGNESLVGVLGSAFVKTIMINVGVGATVNAIAGALIGGETSFEEVTWNVGTGGLLGLTGLGSVSALRPILAKSVGKALGTRMALKLTYFAGAASINAMASTIETIAKEKVLNDRELTREEIIRLFSVQFVLQYGVVAVHTGVGHLSKDSAMALQRLEQHFKTHGTWPHGWNSMTPRERELEQILLKLLAGPADDGLYSALINVMDEVGKWLIDESGEKAVVGP